MITVAIGRDLIKVDASLINDAFCDLPIEWHGDSSREKELLRWPSSFPNAYLTASPPASDAFTLLLARLPADCLVYFEPVVANRYPDFIVIAPSLGVLTIELKGWRQEDIVGADSRAVSLREPSRVGGADSVTRRTHPVRQARDYMFRLMERCRAHRYAQGLLQTEGPHQGGFCFPFSHVAILANLTVEQLQTHPAGDLTEVFPAQRVLPREALLLLEKAGPQEMLSLLAACFDPTWAFPPLTEEQTKALRAIIHPEIVLTPTLPGFTGEEKTPDAAATIAANTSVSELKVLDLQQERHARQIGGGHRLVFGVAGSGKTVLLIARARLLAMGAQGEAEKKRVLVLCYNVVLAAYLRAALADCAPCVSVFHFDGWAARQGIVRDMSAGEDDESLGKRLLTALQAGRGDAQVYGSVLIDEAQDFEPVWFRCVLAAMQDPVDGDLLIVGDGNQGLYRQHKVSWKELGIQAQGRTVSARFELDRNYRNSREIIAVAHPFAGRPRPSDEPSVELADDGVGAPLVDLQKCRRATGIAPMFVDATDRLEECRRAWKLVRDLLRGRWAEREVSPLAPGRDRHPLRQVGQESRARPAVAPLRGWIGQAGTDGVALRPGSPRGTHPDRTSGHQGANHPLGQGATIPRRRAALGG